MSDEAVTVYVTPVRDFTPKRWWRYAVLRGDGIPAEFDGMWFDVDAFVQDVLAKPGRYGSTFVPTNRWEQREDGEVAVVYEWIRESHAERTS
jgi:hypothetical protein